MSSTNDASVQSTKAKFSHVDTYTKKEKKSNRFIIPFILCAAASLGLMQVTQSGINIHFAKWSGHPLRASFISCFVGAICLIPAALWCKPKTDGDEEVKMIQNLKHALAEDKRNWLVFLNGATNVLWLSANIYVPPQIGFSLHIISVIMGQIIASSLIDHYGLIWSQIKKLSVFNFCGICVALIGVIVFKIPKFVDDMQNVDILLFVYMISAMLAGMGFTIQAALNRRLRAMMKSTPYQSSFALFVNATLIITIINLIVYGIQGDWFEVNDDEFYWYIFFGGMFGSIIVSLYIICPEYIGFVPTYTCAIFGSLTTSLIYDALDAFGLNKDGPQPVNWISIIGVVCVGAGAVMVNIKRGGTKQVESDKTDRYGESTEMGYGQAVKSHSEIQSIKVDGEYHVDESCDDDYL